jgi:hypothetical protein
LDLCEFVVGGGEADLESFDFAQLALALRLGDAGFEVVPDLYQPEALFGVRP